MYINDEIFKMAAEESQDHQTTGNSDQCVCVFLSTKNKVSKVIIKGNCTGKNGDFAVINNDRKFGTFLSHILLLN